MSDNESTNTTEYLEEDAKIVLALQKGSQQIILEQQPKTIKPMEEFIIVEEDTYIDENTIIIQDQNITVEESREIFDADEYMELEDIQIEDMEQKTDEPRSAYRKWPRHMKSKFLDPKFPCPKCGKRYSQQKNLKRHLSLECGVVPKFQCPFCPIKCKRNNQLTGHIMAKHSVNVKVVSVSKLEGGCGIEMGEVPGKYEEL